MLFYSFKTLVFRDATSARTVKTIGFLFLIFSVVSLLTVFVLIRSDYLLPHWLPIGFLATCIILVILVLVLFFKRKTVWRRDEKKVIESLVLGSIKLQFATVARKSKSINKNKIRVPWNFFVAIDKEPASSVMGELGYVEFGDRVRHKGICLSVWASQTALAYRIEIESGVDLSFDIVDPLTKMLMNYRPTLAINSIFLEMELGGQSPNPENETGDVLLLNSLMNAMLVKVGLDCPIHVTLVGLDKLPDLYRAALLTESITEQNIFGGFLDPHSDKIANIVNDYFDALTLQITNAQLPALKAQLSPEFSSSLINAPLQMQIVRAQLSPQILSLCQALPPRKKSLNLQSIVFVGSRKGQRLLDPLSRISGQRFFSQQVVGAAEEKVSYQITSVNSAALASLYDTESFSVKQNPISVFKENLWAWTTTIILIVALVGFEYSFWNQHKLIKQANAVVGATFDDYYTKYEEKENDPNQTGSSLKDTIVLLNTLKLALGEYQKVKSFWYENYLPTGSLEQFYRNIYQEELVGRFQKALNDYMQADLYAHYQVEDGTKIIKLLYLESIFNSNQKLNEPELISYFVQSMREEGEVKVSFLKVVNGILKDLFTFNSPNLTFRNLDRNNLFTDAIKEMNAVEIIYEALLAEPKYKKPLRLSALVGPHFSEVFESRDPNTDFTTPIAFTKIGFDEFFKGGEPHDLNKALIMYSTAVGGLTLSEIDYLRQRISEKYVIEYIDIWTSFLMGIQLRKVGEWHEARSLLESLTTITSNPLEGLISTLQTNTDLSEAKVVLAQADSTKKTDAGLAGTDEINTTVIADGPKILAARKISDAFEIYVSEMTPNGEKKTQFDLFLKYARDINIWLNEASRAKSGIGKYLFDQLSASGNTNALVKLNNFSVLTEIKLLREFGLDLASELDRGAMDYVHKYLEAQWRKSVLLPYNNLVKSSFPFNYNATRDLSLETFYKIFSPMGSIETFKRDFLSSYSFPDGSFKPRSTFLQTGLSELGPVASLQLKQAAKISETMFLDGKPNLDFQIRSGFMDASLSKILLSSGKTLYQFSHGPVSWSQQSWPLVGIKDNDLNLRLYERSRNVFDETTQGPWSWFRLGTKGKVQLSPSLGVIEVVFAGERGQSILQFQTSTYQNPFSATFFSGFHLPDTLFSAQ